MREIKFRAWHETAKQMIYSCPVEWRAEKLVCLSYTTEGEETKLPIMQYTGLLDKNGVEIYEGDIVKGAAEHKGQSEVFYGYGQWQPFAYLGTFNGDDFEVIGNIHQNPELLK